MFVYTASANTTQHLICGYYELEGQSRNSIDRVNSNLNRRKEISLTPNNNSGVYSNEHLTAVETKTAKFSIK